MAADAANCEGYLETGTKEKVGMAQPGRLQRSSHLLCSHYLHPFRLKDTLYLHLTEKKNTFAFQSVSENIQEMQ